MSEKLAPADLYERLAAVQHEIWASWMKYLFSKCEECTCTEPPGPIIPADLEERWRRQIDTPYSELTPGEQASDREQVDKFWGLLLHYFEDCQEVPR